MKATEHVWHVPADHPAFAGHFPGRPIVPGVVLLDQALLLAQNHLGLTGGTWRVVQAKFLQPCVPEDELVFELAKGLRGSLQFVVRRQGVDVASGSLALTA